MRLSNEVKEVVKELIERMKGLAIRVTRIELIGRRFINEDTYQQIIEKIREEYDELRRRLED